MLRTTFLFLIALGPTIPVRAVDLYGAAPTAQSIALGGLFAGSASGPTDSLAANPAGLAATGNPVLEISGMGVFAQGSYHNSTPYTGSLSGNAGIAGSFGFASRIRSSRVTLGFGAFPVSLMSDKWIYADPPGTAGATYGVRNNRSAFIALQPTLGVAARVTRRLSVGAAFGVLYNANTLETPYVFQDNALAGLKTLLDLHTSGTGYNGSVGTMYQATRKIEFSASYKTRTTVRTSGHATGSAYAQFQALGLLVDPGFRYRAEVDNIFPQSASATVSWQATRRLRTHLQADWINWQRAFVSLPVSLTNGTNSTINSILSSTSLNDAVPLRWRNQLIWRTGTEFSLWENITLLGGYSCANSPVPHSTLTPLTADIMRNALSTGLSYRKNRYRIELAYQANLPSSESVQNSALLAGEYSHTNTSLWLQTVVLTTGIRF